MFKFFRKTKADRKKTWILLNSSLDKIFTLEFVDSRQNTEIYKPYVIRLDYSK